MEILDDTGGGVGQWLSQTFNPEHRLNADFGLSIVSQMIRLAYAAERDCFVYKIDYKEGGENLLCEPRGFIRI